MPSHLLDYQTVLEEIVEKAIAALLYYRQRLPIVPFWTKPDGSFVTPADYAVQYHLKRTLSSAFPDIPFIGEEKLNLQEDSEKIGKILEFTHLLDPLTTAEDIVQILSYNTTEPSSLYWLVDPIDGTSGFIKNRFFAMAISLLYEGRPILSIMACPSADSRTYKIYSAAKHHGVALFGTAVSSRHYLRANDTLTGKFCEASLAARNQQHHSTRLLSLSLPGCPQPYRVDSQYKYAIVAEGIVDFFIRYPFAISQTKAWDHAPGAFLVEESGGVVSDILGAPLQYNKNLTVDSHPIILASRSPSIHETTLEILQDKLNIVPEEDSLSLLNVSS